MDLPPPKRLSVDLADSAPYHATGRASLDSNPGQRSSIGVQLPYWTNRPIGAGSRDHGYGAGRSSPKVNRWTSVLTTRLPRPCFLTSERVKTTGVLSGQVA
jgi:hypothetical protein